MKTRIRVEKSEYKTVYIPEYYHEGLIFNSWKVFHCIEESSNTARIAWQKTCYNSKAESGSEQFAKDVIDNYLANISDDNREKDHHKHKEISYVKYP